VTGLGHVGVITDTGRRRRRNEDAYVCEPPLFAIADGMGGAQAGEVASRLAAAALKESRADAGGEHRIYDLIQEANRRVYARSSTDPKTSGMGTTITVALVENGNVAFGHVGDSRAYLIRDGHMEQVTEDHSLVNELMKSGKLSREEAETHPQRSVITRALGTDPDVDVDSFSVEAKAGDLFLICSDGLTSMVGDEEILDVVEPRRDNLDAAAKELVAAANRSGGEDNITVVFFEVVADGAQAPAPSETKPMPALDAAPAPQLDEDTLTELDRVPAIDTMVVPPEEARSMGAGAGLVRPDGDSSTVAEEKPEPKPHFGVQAARLIIALAVIVGLLLLVYWLFGQSQ